MEVLNTKLSVRNMVKVFDGKNVLHDISFDLDEGEFLSILGPSGCGKSTIAGILKGRNQNYSGSLKIGAVELSEISEASLMKNITYISKIARTGKQTNNVFFTHVC